MYTAHALLLRVRLLLLSNDLLFTGFACHISHRCFSGDFFKQALETDATICDIIMAKVTEKGSVIAIK